MNTNYLKVIHKHEKDNPNCPCDDCKPNVKTEITVGSTCADNRETHWIEYNTCK